MKTTLEKLQTFDFLGMRIPDYMQEGLAAYIDQGRQPGDFLEAVLCNDLRGAVQNADSQNILVLPAYVAFLYNEAPGNCWGTHDRVDAWLEHHRQLRKRAT